MYVLHQYLSTLLIYHFQLFDASDRGSAMSFYLIAAFGGPIIGPLSGSFLAAATTDT